MDCPTFSHRDKNIHGLIEVSHFFTQRNYNIICGMMGCPTFSHRENYNIMNYMDCPTFSHRGIIM